jgi:hypothetical protein
MKFSIQVFVLAIASSLAASAAEKWDAREIVGYSLTLEDKNDVQIFRFTDHASALAEFGSKEGAVSGPVVSWKIDADGILRITLGGKETVILRKISATGNRYLVEEGGVKREYIRADWTEYQASHSKKP